MGYCVIVSPQKEFASQMRKYYITWVNFSLCFLSFWTLHPTPHTSVQQRNKNKTSQYFAQMCLLNGSSRNFPTLRTPLESLRTLKKILLNHQRWPRYSSRFLWRTYLLKIRQMQFLMSLLWVVEFCTKNQTFIFTTSLAEPLWMTQA